MCKQHRPINDILFDYEKAIKKEKGKYISEMIFADNQGRALPRKIFSMLHKWDGCGTKIQGYKNSNRAMIRHKCRHQLCPRCNSWMKKKAAKKINKKIRIVAGNNRSPKDYSYVTVNGPKLLLGSDFKKELQIMKRRLRYRLGKISSDIAFIGEFEIAPQIHPKTKELIGKLHVHGWCYHPSNTRKDIKAELKIAYPDHKAIHIRSPKKDDEDDLDEDVEEGAEYVCDNKLDMEIDKFGIRTPEAMLNLLISIESIRPRGRMGLRFEYGIKAAIVHYNKKYPKKRSKTIKKTKHINNCILSLLATIRPEMVEETVGADPPCQYSPSERQTSDGAETTNDTIDALISQNSNPKVSDKLLRLRLMWKNESRSRNYHAYN